MGTYKAVITLAASANYDGDEATVYIEITGASITFGEITNANGETGAKIEGEFDYHPNIKDMLYPAVTPSQEVAEGDLYFQYAVLDQESNTWSDWIDWTDTNYPFAIGVYRVRAAVKASDTYGESFSEPQYFNITKAYVDIWNPTLTFDYSDSVQKPSFIVNDVDLTEYYNTYCNIVWSNENSKDADTYTVTLTLKDTANSEWNVQSGDTNKTGERVYTYTIKPKKIGVTITVNDATLTEGVYKKPYDGSAVTVTVTVDPNTFPAGTPTYYVHDGKDAEGKDKWKKLDAAPVNAGYYKVEVKVTSTDANYEGNTVEQKFEITTVATEIGNAPDFVGGKYYQNMFTPTATGAVVYVKGTTTPVEGTWTWGAVNFNGGNGTVAYTFTPDDTNYGKLSGTFKVTFATVAHIGNTYYGMFEGPDGAFANAAYGDVIVVHPFDKDLADNKQYPTITSNVTINSGVTLLLPYGENGNGKNTYDSKGVVTDPAFVGGYWSPSDKDKTKCHVQVIIAAGVHVTNRGTIEIAGQYASGFSGSAYSGVTAGEHAKLLLGAGAIIENMSGSKIYAVGFIRELDSDNKSQIIMNSGSKLYQPYAVRDFKGGSLSEQIYYAINNGKPIPAFNLFVMLNVSPTVIYKEGSELKVWASLATTKIDLWGAITGGGAKESQANNTEVNFIGNTEASVIQWTTANSYITAKYNDSTEVTELHFYGGAKTNSMSLKIDVLGTNFDISTEKCFFALSYHYNITLHKLEEQAEAEYTMNQMFKLMPGAVFVVDEGVHLTTKTFVVYVEAQQNADGSYTAEDGLHNGFLTNYAGGGNMSCTPYPSSAQLVAKGLTNDCTAGTLIVNGHLTVTEAFGGKIHSTSNGAIVELKGAVKYKAIEAHNYTTSEGAVSTNYSLNEFNEFNLQTVLIGNESTTPTSAQTYTYANGVWKQPIVRIEFNSAGGKGVASIGVPFEDGIYQNLPTPTREHYTFVGWKDANGNLITNGVTTLPSDCVAGNTITLTAQWTPTEYTVQYVGIDDDGNIVNGFSIADGKFTVRSTLSWPGVTAAVPYGYTHSGWKFNGANVVNPVLADWLMAAKDAENNTITVYVLLTEAETYKYVFDFNNNKTGYGITSITLSDKLLGLVPSDYSDVQNKVVYAADGTTKYETTSTVYQWYFEGWYLDADCTQKYDPATYTPATDATEIVLYANWLQKVTVKINYGDDVLNYTEETVYVMPGGSFTVSKDIHAGDVNPKISKYFNTWSVSDAGSVSMSGKTGTVSEDATAESVITITAEWGTKRTITVTNKNGSPSITLKAEGFETTYTSVGTYYLREGQKMTVSASAKSNKTYKLRIYFDGTVVQEETTWMLSGTVTISDTYTAGASDGTIQFEHVR